MIQTSRWEGCTAKGHSGQVGSGTAGSSDGTTHLPATPISLGAGQQPCISRQYSCRVSLQDWESPLTPLPPNLLPLVVRILMYVGGRVLKAKTITAIPREHERSSVRTTNKQTPCQVGEHPSGAPRNVPPA